jgi:hypothetical protein
MSFMSARARLLQRRQHLLATLPPLTEVLRASFFVRRRRCGGRNCHCTQGPGHRTAYVTTTFAGGSTEQIALSGDLEALAQTWVGNYTRWWQAVEKISAINRELLRQHRQASAPARRVASPRRGRVAR